MALLDYVLREPSYGWKDKDGQVVVPTSRQSFQEFLSRINIFESRKNWLAFTGWFLILLLVPFFVVFMLNYLTWKTAIVGFIYSMILMGTHGTIWYHRYCTHQAYQFKNSFWRKLTQNLTIKVIPEEIYVISHHVHHAKSDQPGDPYNAQAGFLYCFLADTNHQPIAQDLDEKDYTKLVAMMKHTGVSCNTYKQYQYWGSLAHPVKTYVETFLNWAFWYGVFYLLGGNALACAIFGSSVVWAVGVRTFNYEGHGKGEDKKEVGTDFNQADLSINQIWPGIVAGEWHNNHHLFPTSARSGFLKHQIDFAWVYVYVVHKLGGIVSYQDYKKDFLERYWKPYTSNPMDSKSESKPVQKVYSEV